MPTVEGYEKKCELIRQEVEICKRLASNDVKTRRKGLSVLKKLLNNTEYETNLDADDFARIWNGLFNYVWMSDKPLVQENDVETISSLIHEINSYNLAMLFVRGFYDSIARHWNRISHYRTDKFLMFIRRFVRQVLILLKNSEWDAEKIKLFGAEMYSALQILPLGLVLHLNDIYNEEIAKVTEGNIPTKALISLLKCYVECIINLKPSMNVVNSISVNIFAGLIKQLKLYIQQKAATEFDLDELMSKAQKLDGSDTENQLVVDGDQNLVFDPRPGNVNVFLPYIEFDENTMAEFLDTYASASRTPRKAKNILSQIIGMLRSVTKLRKSVEKSQDVFSNVHEKRNKRKRQKARKPFSSLVKKSCKKLEEEEPIRAFKRLGKIPRAWLTSSSDSASVLASSAWTVTDSESTSCSNVVAVNTSQDWTITEDSPPLSDKIAKRLSESKSCSNVAEVNTSQDWTVTEDSHPLSDETAQRLSESTSCSNVAVVNTSQDWTITEDSPPLSDRTVKRLDNRKLRVSFAAEVAAQCTYEAETESTADSSVRPEDVSVVVPQSAVKNVPNLLKHGNYTVVDFSPRDDDLAASVNQDRIEGNADGKQQVSTDVAESAAESDTDYDLSCLFKTPPKRRGRKSLRYDTVVQEVKRSKRIADKVALAAKLAGETKK